MSSASGNVNSLGIYGDGGPFAFKDANGQFHPLTADRVLALTAAVSAHVQACFAQEAEIIALDA